MPLEYEMKLQITKLLCRLLKELKDYQLLSHYQEEILTLYI